MLAIQGKRLLADDAAGFFDVEIVVDEARGLYAVFQGLGSPEAARTAVKFGIQAFEEYFDEHRGLVRNGEPAHVVALIDEAFQHTSQILHGIATRNSEFFGLGAVASALVRVGPKMILAHVGNTRAYMKRGKAVHLLTREHTRAQELVRRGLLEPQAVKLSEHRAVVTRALGRDRGVQIDTILFDILPDDLFLLCNGALSDSLDGSRIDTALDAGEFVEVRVRELIAEAGRVTTANPAAALVAARDQELPAADEIRRRELVTLKIEVLRGMYLFEELELDQLLKVIEMVAVYDAKAGEAIVHEGDIGEHLFVILDGETEVIVGGRKIGTLYSGSHFGEIAILVDRPRIATVRAVCETRLLVIPRSNFLALVRGEEEIGVKLLYRLSQELANRLAHANEQLR